MKKVEFPKDRLMLERLDRLLILDKEKGGKYSFFIIGDREDNLSEKKHILYCFPVDVPEDDKPHYPFLGMTSDTMKIREMAVQITVSEGCLRPAFKGSISNLWTIWFILPPTSDRLKKGAIDAFGENIIDFVDTKNTEFSTIESLKGQNEKKGDVLKKSGKFTPFDEFLEVKKLLEKYEKGKEQPTAKKQEQEE